MAINLYRQPEFFWKAYSSAQKQFGNYDFQAIPTPITYEENVLSFLENLGYQKRDFMFLPETALHSPSAIDSIKPFEGLPHNM